jgi:hypothetical protein
MTQQSLSIVFRGRLFQLFWFRANQTLLFLLNAACLAEKQQIPISYSLVWYDRGTNPRSTTLEASTITITPPMLFHLNTKKCVSVSMCMCRERVWWWCETWWRQVLGVAQNLGGKDSELTRIQIASLQSIHILTIQRFLNILSITWGRKNIVPRLF